MQKCPDCKRKTKPEDRTLTFKCRSLSRDDLVSLAISSSSSSYLSVKDPLYAKALRLGLVREGGSFAFDREYIYKAATSAFGRL